MFAGPHGPALVSIPPAIYQGFHNVHQSTGQSYDVSEGRMARITFLQQHNVAIAPHSVLSDWPVSLAPLMNPLVGVLARHRGVSPAALLQRHQLQSGRMVLTRSQSLAHMRSNLHDMFSFALSDTEMQLIDDFSWLVQDCSK